MLDLQKVAFSNIYQNMCVQPKLAEIQLKLVLFSVEKSCLGQIGGLHQLSKIQENFLRVCCL